jgi:hypothetical protein
MGLLRTLRHRFFKLVLITIAFQVMNMSIDPVDRLIGAQDIAINEMESCVEFILEMVLDKQDAIEETDEPDDSTDRQVSQLILYISQNIIEAKARVCVGGTTKHSTLKVDRFYTHTIPINSPPPKHS